MAEVTYILIIKYASLPLFCYLIPDWTRLFCFQTISFVLRWFVTLRLSSGWDIGHSQFRRNVVWSSNACIQLQRAKSCRKMCLFHCHSRNWTTQQTHISFNFSLFTLFEMWYNETNFMFPGKFYFPINV